MPLPHGGLAAYAQSMRCLLIVLVLAATVGCSGYTTQTTFGTSATGDEGTAGPAVEIRSVDVPIFENKTLYTGLERDLTDALIKELQTRTPWHIQGAGNSDTLLTGTIVEVEKTRLSNQIGSGLAQDIILSITVDFQWKNRRTGEILVERRSFRGGDWYTPSHPVGERPDLAEFAASAELARDIVSALRSDF